jgi:hypothetical protein
MSSALRCTAALLSCCASLLLLLSPASAHSAGPQASVPSAKSLAQHQPAKPLWHDLSPAQQQALSPLAVDWDNLDGQRKKKWIEMIKHYPSLNPDQQARMQERMRDWVTLTPDQRRIARESYARAEKLGPDQKSAKWQEYQQLSDEQKNRLAEEALAKKRVTNLPTPTQDKGKIIPPSKAALKLPQHAQPVPTPVAK